MLRNLLSTLLCWALGLSPLLAQLQNTGAMVEIQGGVYLVSTLDVQNTNGGTLKNAGTLVTTESLSNTTGATLTGNGAYRVGINWTNSANFVAGSSTVTFDGAQNSAVASGGSAFYNVNLYKFAGFHVALSDPMNINNALGFQSGGNHLLIGNFNLSLGSVTGFGSNRYITTGGTGKVSKNVTAAFTFPVGFDKTTYNPLTLTQSGTPDLLSVRCLQNARANGASGAAFTQNTADVSWDVMEQTPGGSNLTMQFQWGSGDELLLFNRASMSASRHDGANWQAAGAVGAATGGNPYQFSAAGITAAGVFALSNPCFLSDGVPPGIVCPANIVRSTDAGQCSAVVNYATPTTSDNCTGATATLFSGLASGSAFTKGSSSVVWQATDGAGLTKRCTFTVTVNDNQLPGIVCPSNVLQNTDPGLCAAMVTYPSPTFSDNCTGGGVSLVTGLNSGSAFPKGINTVVWKATDGSGLTKTCSFRVTVNDTQAPTITCPPNQSKTTDSGLCTAVATYANATFTDNCGGGSVVKFLGLNSGSAFPKGVNNVVFKATDASGNQSQCTMTVTVTDVQLPTVSCPANIAVTGSNATGICSAIVTFSNPAAADNCGIESSYLWSGLASGSVFPVGVTTNIWRATDHSGLTATCAFTVTVGCGTNSSKFDLASGERSSKLEMPTIEQGHSVNMRLAPNPATTAVIITTEGLDTMGGLLTVFDAQGRMMWEQAVNTSAGMNTLDVSGGKFTAGLYLVILQGAGDVVTKRLVVVKD